MIPELIAPDWADLPNVRVFCSTREGGVSQPPYNSFNVAEHVGDDHVAVQKNRELLRSLLPGAPALQWLDQVHGREVLVVTDAASTRNPLTADGLVSRSQGLACCVMTADCLPVVLVSEDQGEVAVAHAGWRGLASGVLEQTISKMKTSPENIRAWLGPAIGPCHFEVGEDVRQAFLTNSLAGAESCFAATAQKGKYMADLNALARLRLTAAGVPRVDACGRCSYCESAYFYSYRRDQQTGRNVTGVYLLA